MIYKTERSVLLKNTQSVAPSAIALRCKYTVKRNARAITKNQKYWQIL